jgi:hypothetical protein
MFQYPGGCKAPWSSRKGVYSNLKAPVSNTRLGVAITTAVPSVKWKINTRSFKTLSHLTFSVRHRIPPCFLNLRKFKCQLLPSMRCFTFIIHLNVFVILQCTEAGSMRGNRGPCIAPRRARKGQSHFPHRNTCQVEVSETGRSLVQGSPTDCGVCLTVIKWK